MQSFSLIGWLKEAQWIVLLTLVMLANHAYTHVVAASDGTAKPATTKRASTRPTTNPTCVEHWLQRIEAKHRQIKTLAASLRYERNQLRLQDRQIRFGTLVYVSGPPPMFAIHFDRILVNNRTLPRDRWYIYDGRFLVERLHDRKQFFKRELSPTEMVKQHNPLALGQGPFVLPLPLRKQRILERFTVKIVAPTRTNPPNTIHLQLTPIEATKINLVHIDLWHDRETLLPVKAYSIDKSKYESIVHLDKVKLNRPIDATSIDTSPPTKDGWRIENIPFKKK